MALVMDPVNIIGAVAAIWYSILFVPQARATWANRNDPHSLRGLSVASQVMLAINGVLWIAYGIGVGAWWSAASSPLPLATSLFVIWLIYRSRAMTSEEDPTYLPLLADTCCECCRCRGRNETLHRATGGSEKRACS